MKKLSVALLLAFGVAGSAHAATPAPTTASVLDGLRAAMLSRPLSSISSIHSSGTVDVFGIHAATQEWVDPRTLRFASTEDGGALSGGQGWDGSSSWSQDYAGLVHVDGGRSGRLQAIDQAYLDGLGFLRPDLGGAAVAYEGEKSEDGKTFDVLAITPPQGTRTELWIDPQTHLIAKEKTTIGVVSETTLFSGYRRIDGLSYPFRVLIQTSNGNTIAIVTTALKLNEDIAGRLSVPASNVHDFSIASGNSTTVPLQIVNNHLYLHVMLDGQGPYTFIFDTGGDYIVTPEVAKALHAKRAGGLQLRGVGNATESAGFTHVDSISIGDATVKNQYVLVLPIARGFGVAEGLHIDGMVGYQLVARFLTTIDYAGSKLTLALPGAAPSPRPGGAAMPFFFDGTIPRIPIGIGDVATTGEVDTGSRAALSLSSPFVAAHPAIAAFAKTPPTVDGFGVGGPSFARLGRIPSLTLGPFELSNTIAAFGVQTKGAFADPFNPANLGGAIWRRFTLTLDYPNSQLFLAKNASFGTPFPYDRSGMFLIDAKGAYTVISVCPGTPAATGGLAKGDVILTADGAPAASLAGLRALLSGPIGTVVRLHVRSAKGEERDIALTLQDYT